MANLVENAEWVDGIYQLETIDPVEGGPNGIDNLQAKQLGNRTQFLKTLILAAQNSLAGHEAAADPHPQYLTTAEGNSIIATAVAALVNSSPATLDTLNELAAALGNDPNFATTITTALGNKQPLDQTLTALAALATAANKLIYATGLDAFSTTDFTAFARTLLDDADAATMRNTLGLGDVSTKNINNDFMALFSTSGYQKLPSGMIFQWVETTNLIGSGGVITLTMPITYPNSHLFGGAFARNGSSPNSGLISSVKNSINTVSVYNNGNATVNGAYVLSIGF